jgi:Transposase IS66 family
LTFHPAVDVRRGSSSRVGEQLRREVVAANYFQTDDTRVTALGDQGGRFKGRLWVHLDSLRQQVVFDATATHERDAPAAWFADSRGALQADAYAGCDGLLSDGHVAEIGRMAPRANEMWSWNIIKLLGPVKWT